MSLAKALAAESEKLSHCVHCGFCLPACPTYTRLGDEADSPRGRLYLMRAVVEGRLDAGSDAFQTHIDRCLGCRACEPVCPSGVEYGHLLERAREASAEARRPGLGTRLLPAVMASPPARFVFMLASRLFRATGIPALGARLLPGGGVGRRLRMALGMLASSAPSASLRAAPRGRPGPSEAEPVTPPAASAASGPRLPVAERKTSPASGPGASNAGERRRAGVLTGCVQEGLFSRVNEATKRVLRANGFEVVIVKGQRCCGALHAHSGDLEGARRLARRNVEAFEAAELDVVVANAAGCGAVMKEYGELLEGEPAWAERARRIDDKVRDISEILSDAGPRGGGALPLRVAYDAPCHLLHAQRVEDPPLRLLAAIPELEVAPLRNAQECCGGAGIYGITHPELGGRIGADKADAVRESGARVVASGNPGCIMQIGAEARMAGLRVDVVHPVELLDESYRRAGFYA